MMKCVGQSTFHQQLLLRQHRPRAFVLPVKQILETGFTLAVSACFDAI
jgi:hypothetical protein